MSDEPPPIETCPAPDRILHLPLGKAVGVATSATLMKSAGLELIRLVIPAGKEIPAHRAPGEITVQCIEGHVAFEHDGHAVDLTRVSPDAGNPTPRRRSSRYVASTMMAEPMKMKIPPTTTGSCNCP